MTDGERQVGRGRPDAEVIVEMIDSIPDSFMILAPDGRVEYVNSAGAALYGRTPETLVGHNLWTEFPAAAAGPRYQAIGRVLAERRPLTVEDHDDGRFWELSVYPLRRGLAIHSREITARKHAEELRRRLDRQAALRGDVAAALARGAAPAEMLQACAEAMIRDLDMALARIWLLDETGTLVMTASAGIFTNLDGDHARIALGERKIGRIAAERAPLLSNDLMHDTHLGDVGWARAEGLSSFAGYPLLVDGRLIGVLAVFGRRLLSEDLVATLGAAGDTIAQGVARKQAEQQLADRAQELARSNADLEQFAYVASHDLQEPLRMVSSYVQLLARRYRGKLDSNADEFISYAVDGAQRMGRLINDLLAYSRAGRSEKPQVPVATEALLAHLLRGLGPTLRKAGATITHDPLPTVLGDETQLMQVFQNLIGNALKFRGADPPRVHVSATRDGAEWRFLVRDNGIGIEPDYFDRIFVIFQRLHGRDEYPGTGIGLSICKKIVERAGGRIWVESEKGRGSTFCFTWPAVPESAAPPAVASSTLASRAGGTDGEADRQESEDRR